VIRNKLLLNSMIFYLFIYLFILVNVGPSLPGEIVGIDKESRMERETGTVV